jgi:hypothetical protein
VEKVYNDDTLPEMDDWPRTDDLVALGEKLDLTATYEWIEDRWMS